MTQRDEVNTCYWKNYTNSLVQQRVATNPQCVKNAMPTKCNKAKPSNRLCLYIMFTKFPIQSFSSDNFHNAYQLL